MAAGCTQKDASEPNRAAQLADSQAREGPIRAFPHDDSRDPATLPCKMIGYRAHAIGELRARRLGRGHPAASGMGAASQA